MENVDYLEILKGFEDFQVFLDRDGLISGYTSIILYLNFFSIKIEFSRFFDFGRIEALAQIRSWTAEMRASLEFLEVPPPIR